MPLLRPLSLILGLAPPLLSLRHSTARPSGLTRQVVQLGSPATSQARAPGPCSPSRWHLGHTYLHQFSPSFLTRRARPGYGVGCQPPKSTKIHFSPSLPVLRMIKWVHASLNHIHDTPQLFRIHRLNLTRDKSPNRHWWRLSSTTAHRTPKTIAELP